MMDLCNSDEERYAKKLVELLHFDKINIEATPDNLKSMTSCGE